MTAVEAAAPTGHPPGAQGPAFSGPWFRATPPATSPALLLESPTPGPAPTAPSVQRLILMGGGVAAALEHQSLADCTVLLPLASPRWLLFLLNLFELTVTQGPARLRITSARKPLTYTGASCPLPFVKTTPLYLGTAVAAYSPAAESPCPARKTGRNAACETDTLRSRDSGSRRV